MYLNKTKTNYNHNKPFIFICLTIQVSVKCFLINFVVKNLNVPSIKFLNRYKGCCKEYVIYFFLTFIKHKCLIQKSFKSKLPRVLYIFGK